MNNFLEIRTDSVLENLFTEYSKTKQPITISFREIIENFNHVDRATHSIHAYPAKLLTHIPLFFLSNNILSQPGDLVLDPFCGSGTVLLESILGRRNAIGVDVNPLARLITKVKTTPLNMLQLKQSIKRLKERISSEPKTEIPDVVNIDYWFYPHVKKDLLRIREAIDKTKNEDIKSFFLVCFSSCVKKVSLADPRLSVPVRLKHDQYHPDHWLYKKTNEHLNGLKNIDVINEFFKILASNEIRMEKFTENFSGETQATIIGYDAKNLKNQTNNVLNNSILNNSVDLVITSPPYVSAQKYIRASSLNLGWLDLCKPSDLKGLEAASVGREHYPKSSYNELIKTDLADADKLLEDLHVLNPLRAHIAGNYLLEMQKAFGEIYRVLKPNGYLVLIIGNNQVCGQEFETQHYLKRIAEKTGLTLLLSLIDDIRSRGLMTKRNKTASLITREWVLVFQRGK